MKTVYVIHRSPSDTLENCSVALTYDERLLRRRKLQTEEGDAFILDLEKATSGQSKARTISADNWRKLTTVSMAYR